MMILDKFRVPDFLSVLRQYGIYPLCLINVLLFGTYHNVFAFGIDILPVNFFIRTIIMLNWIFGFAFVPAFGYFFYFYYKKQYKKFLALILFVIAVDLLFSCIQKCGAIGFVFGFLEMPQPLQAIGALGIITITHTWLNKNEQVIKAAKIRRIREPKVEKESLLPPISLLTIGQKVSISINVDMQKKVLMQTLKDFGIDAKIVDTTVGPVVTLYSVELAAGVKSVRLINLADDIARSMQTFSARIATIPGRNLIGIEIANEKRQTVYFKEGLQTDVYRHFEGNLPLYLGSNIYGEHEIFDLAAMPHLLVAGTTGSGKSVGIHTMLLSLLYKRLPSELKLILVDPKTLELMPYKDIPHLLLPVVTEPKQAVLALKWAVKEMEDRYKNMSRLGVRNILTYNAKIDQTTPDSEDKLPFIVVVIDEMADLMLVAGKEIEVCVQRLAQMGRAAGIHIITATQRPSVDVITGTIKANFPTRISFKLSSKIDSRTILGDLSGAEQLLGSGDMLYLATNGKLHRIHGSFVSEADVAAVTDFWRAQGKPSYIELRADETEEGGIYASSDEPYYQEAVALIRSTKKVSTSFLQRNFPIGYNRAAKIIEQMEKEGIISEGDSAGRNRRLL